MLEGQAAGMGGHLRGIRAGVRVACMGGHAGLWASASEDGSGHEHRGDGLYHNNRWILLTLTIRSKNGDR